MGRTTAGRHLGETAEAATIRVALDTLRNPNDPLEHRLDALDLLLGRPSLNDAEKGSVVAHAGLLARLVAARGEVRSGRVTYWVDGTTLRRRMT